MLNGKVIFWTIFSYLVKTGYLWQDWFLKLFLGDKYCDDENNHAGCEYDGGDCCGPSVKKNWCKVCQCLDPKFG